MVGGPDAAAFPEAAFSDAVDPAARPQAVWFFSRLPPDVAASLSEEQKRAIAETLGTGWSDPPINIRFTLPFPGQRFYMTVLAGEEKRSRARRKTDRARYPLRTLGNVFFFLGLATVFYTVMMVLLAIQAAIIEC